MALINHAKKEINAKVVYYGPAGSGKNTVLSYIYSRIKTSLRGDFRSVPVGEDNLLFFDFSPFEAPLPNGYRVRLHVYTLTGIVSNPATWKMTLKGTDGIVILVNPSAVHAVENGECITQLRDFLSAYGVGLLETPAVLQLNTFTQENQPEDALHIAETLDLAKQTICHSHAPSGEGLLEALTTLSRQVFDRITMKNERSGIDISPPPSSRKREEPEPPQQRLSPDSDEIRYTDDVPNIALMPQPLVSEGNTIQIPLEISHGGSLRRLVVTIHVDTD